jgi:two-component system response regulator AtoC
MVPILIVDNEEKFCKLIKTALELDNIQSTYVLSGEQAFDWIKNNSVDLIVSDLRMDGMNGLELLKKIKDYNPDIEFIVMTAFASQKTAIEALREGASDYLIKPFEMDELILRIRRILLQKKLQGENRELRSQVEKPVSFDRMIGRSKKMKQVYELIHKAAQSESTVLVTGESGTGKELVAEIIHYQSSEKYNSFIAINCAAIPENLLESELFGHEKGAFTGASHRKIGKFELASHGTIFLDEVGDTSLIIQAKLLRVLQNKEIFRLGGNTRINVDTRVVAATNHDLEQMVKQGKFRQDLFYRLNVFPIHLPPLREKKEDIPELVNHFLKKYGVEGIHKEALKILMDYDWPGNIRELQNVIERAAILSSSFITSQELPSLRSSLINDIYGFQIPSTGLKLDQFEKYLIQQAIQKADGNKTVAAQLLGITRRRLYSMMKSLGI